MKEMPKTKTTVIFDIDGTLADVNHRRHYVMSEPKDWDAWNSRMHKDDVHHNVKSLLDIFWYNDYSVYLFTGRFEKYREITTLWLANNGIGYDILRMRADGDYRSDFVVKQEMLEGIDKDDILFVVDDRDSVVKMWREEGLTCLQCAEGTF